MTDEEHLTMMIKQYNSTKSVQTKKQLYKAIRRLKTKMENKKSNIKYRKDNVYIYE